ncbi:hypothetical protein UCRPA7_5098 [Phaeoacremonium minimum UCRPA7]|uniref:Uncharacterized protein n=1 Tax=Phaeoacremonium minimum (strain UCR-PA7) TaxID=1286976 RepID=R8BJ82_PHAM7|nr:hypothetical protein UCRPA7_5098 [Phaeoacremonium minimum UCRPA7]EON99380.1 hypothetical protein UCRPA7_5098 [Phaeoacremonium minimum UCRPA7]
MDEEEQETLIQTLSDQNAARNAQFQKLLLAVPVLSTIPYLVAMFRPSTFLLSVFGLTSLLSTTYLLYTLPPAETGIRFLDNWNAPKQDSAVPDEGPSASASRAPRQGRQRPRSSSFSFVEQKSPLETYLPYLNLGLCGVLILTGFVVRDSSGRRLGLLGLGNLPAIVYFVVLAAKVVMAGVDPETELGSLRYEYKGA